LRPKHFHAILFRKHFSTSANLIVALNTFYHPSQHPLSKEMTMREQLVQRNPEEKRARRKQTQPASQAANSTEVSPPVAQILDPRVSREARQNAILRMQQTHGNAAVRRMLARRTNSDSARDLEQVDKQAAAPASKPHIKITGFSLIPAAKPPDSATHSGRDKSLASADDNEEQDKYTSVTNFASYSKSGVQGVSIQVEATGGQSDPNFPDGPKWTQTIETSSPLNGATSPYVDPHPNDDDKPYYYTDSEHAARPTTFVDRPTRAAPASGSLSWQATLGLNNVNQANKTVVGLEYLTYGFLLDNAGTLTLNNPVSTGGSNHISTLSSEWPDYKFS
jgi:hypothetical protein